MVQWMQHCSILQLSSKSDISIQKSTQNELKTKYLKQSIEVGSTCLLLVMYKYNNKQYIDVLNTGDSRAVICSNNKATEQG